MSPGHACWVALEGGEGCGKSTQARRLAATLGAVLTREPGGTRVGSRIRDVLLDPSSTGLDARAEALLMAADRAEHVAAVVAPALDAGRMVVSDRSVWSSLAYQGIARGLGVDQVREVSDWATGGRWPDLAVLVDVPPEVVGARLRAAGRVPDRLEAEGDGFHGLVRDGFRRLAAAEPDRWLVVDGAGGEDEVAATILDGVRSRLGPSLGLRG